MGFRRREERSVSVMESLWAFHGTSAREFYMLVLSRKVSESIWIGDDIKVTVERINGGTVSISIDAPRNVKILRAELADSDERDAAKP